LKDERKPKAELIRELKSLRRRIVRLEKAATGHIPPAKSPRPDEMLFRVVADFTSDWEYWMDPLGRFLYTSPSCEAITGYPPGSFHDDPGLLLKIAHPDDRSFLLGHLEDVKNRENSASVEFRILAAGGDVRWIGHRCRPVVNDRGEWMGTRGSNRDITSQKHLEHKIRDSEKKYRFLYENSYDAILLTVPDGRILSANPAACLMFGLSEEEIVARGRHGIVDVTDPRLSAALKERERTGRFRGELRFIRGDGRFFQGEMTSVIYVDEIGNPFTSMIIRDVTERKTMGKALRESEERYHTVMDHQTEVISRFRQDGILLFVNKQFCRFFGKNADEIIGRKWQPAAVDEDVPHIEAQLKKLTPANPTVIIENRVYSGYGSIRWMQFINRGFFNESGGLTEIQSVGRDVTDRKEMEQELSNHRKNLALLTSRLVTAQETERKTIAREMPDEIGQALTAVQFNLDELSRLTTPEDPKRARIAESETMIGRILEQIHEMSFDLRPAMLDDLGLVPTVRWYAKRFSLRTGIGVDVRAEMPENRMHSEIETNLYRIVQEALTNVAKHARATKVAILLNLERESVQLSLIDDGVGFDPKGVLTGRADALRLGLIGMNERVASIMGTMEIDSGSNRGTALKIVVPWRGTSNG
jgi:PAS domain S-box-containing protein